MLQQHSYDVHHSESCQERPQRGRIVTPTWNGTESSFLVPRTAKWRAPALQLGLTNRRNLTPTPGYRPSRASSLPRLYAHPLLRARQARRALAHRICGSWRVDLSMDSSSGGQNTRHGCPRCGTRRHTRLGALTGGRSIPLNVLQGTESPRWRFSASSGMRVIRAWRTYGELMAPLRKEASLESRCQA